MELHCALTISLHSHKLKTAQNSILRFAVDAEITIFEKLIAIEMVLPGIRLSTSCRNGFSNVLPVHIGHGYLF